MSDNDRHESDMRMATARSALTNALIAAGLSTTEKVQMLLEEAAAWNRYMLRDELHPERLDDEAIEWYEQYLAKAKAGQAERKAEEALEEENG